MGDRNWLGPRDCGTEPMPDETSSWSQYIAYALCRQDNRERETVLWTWVWAVLGIVVLAAVLFGVL